MRAVEPNSAADSRSDKLRACEVIVECCQNHNGSWKILDRMVRSAVDAGARYIKMQSIWVADLTRRERFQTGGQGDGYSVIQRPYEPEYERLSKLELTLAEHEQFVHLCHSLGVTPMTTVFAAHRLEEVRKTGFEWLKVASYDCGSARLLTRARELYPNVVVSTGASYDEEIERCVEILGDSLRGLLHCVTVYPTTLEMTHLARMARLRRLTANVGYSDHSKPADTGLLASKWAILLGARWVERHFTILDRSETRDGPVSITPVELRELVEFASNPVETHDLAQARDLVIGDEQRALSAVELTNRDYYRGRFADVRNHQVVYNFDSAAVG